MTQEGHLRHMPQEHPIDLLDQHDFDFIRRLRGLSAEQITTLIEHSSLHARTLAAWHDIVRIDDHDGALAAEYYREKFEPLRKRALKCPLLDDDERAWLEAIQ